MKLHDHRWSLKEFSFSEESSKYEDEDNFGVEWEDELISALKELKKSREDKKVLKEQLEIVEGNAKQIDDMHEDFKKQMKVKEEELHCAKGRIKELEETSVRLRNPRGIQNW